MDSSRLKCSLFFHFFSFFFLFSEKPMDFNMPLNRLTTLKPSCGKLIQVAMPNVCQTNYSGEYSSLGQYHWDCSDWVRNSQNPLPDITEVPGAEIADSSSFQSNDSNESKPRSYVVPSKQTFTYYLEISNICWNVYIISLTII